ncbi:MAG: Protein hit [Mycoplasmataceae bacterium]|nr:MAG: Protein hit [Mycoplasmataceae bacterium]
MCLFCKIAQKEISSHVILENDKAIAILDINPVSDGHTLLITKNHFTNISEINEEDWSQLLPLLKKVIDKLQNTLQPSGFNIISNMNEIAYQTVFHLHIHIIPKYEYDKGFIWTTKPNLKNDLEWVAKKIELE